MLVIKVCSWSKHWRLFFVRAAKYKSISCQLEECVVIREEQDADGQDVTPLGCLCQYVELIDNESTCQH